jgi:hypothetical protein
MKIESLIKRKNGTKVQLDAPKREYHFAPENGNFNDPHVCEVEEENHARILLRISGGYRLAEGETAPPDEDITPPRLKGSAVHDARYTIKGGDVIELEDLVNMAFDDSGLDEDDWNELADQQRYEYIDTTLRELQEGFHETNDAGKPADDENHDDAEYNSEGKDENQHEEKPKAEDETKPEDNQKGGDLPSRKELVAAFKEKFGRNPSNKLSVEDLYNAINEKD